MVISMKKIISSCLVIAVAVLLVFAGQARAQTGNVNNFSIKSFSADYYLDKNEKDIATLKVKEQIIAVFPQYDQNHGILRAIPKTYKGNSLDLNIKSVTDEKGRQYKYTTSTNNENLVLKIGDPVSYARGPTVYNIEYSLNNVVSFPGDQPELYWDVNGDQWPQTFGSVEARVHVPSSIAEKLKTDKRCFAGEYGSTASNCEISEQKLDDETVVTFKTGQLGKNQTLSFVMGFDVGTFQPDKIAALIAVIIFFGIILGVLLPPLIAGIFIYRRWRKTGRDPKGKGVIIPQYLAPKNMDSILADFVLNEKLQQKTISAAITELAATKYLSIYEVKKGGFISKKTEYELELIKPKHDSSPQLQAIIDMIFGDNPKAGDKVNPKDNKDTHYKKVKELDKTAGARSAEQGFFVVDPNKARKMYLTPGAVVLVVGFVLLFTGVGIPLGIGLIIAGVIVLVGSGTMPARTQAGVEMRDYLKGLKEYIKLAEVERIKYLQSPEGVKQYGSEKDGKTKIKLFEKLLPYAMLFGLEKEWADEFKDIYQEPPDWYHGNWSTFNTVYLASSLSSFSAVNSTSFAPPGSSSSSGFSGGGFSGGGGGGGGGGGW